MRSFILLLVALTSPMAALAQPGGYWRRAGPPVVLRNDAARFGRSGGGDRGYGGYRSSPYGEGWGSPNAPAPRFEPPRSEMRSRLWNRGQVLPPDYRGASVADPGRYHLRTPPSGYGWVGDGRNAYLMQRSTGMVLDSVPEAYTPPRTYRRR